MTCPATHPRCQHTRETDTGSYGCTCPAALAARARNQKARRHRAEMRRPGLLTDPTGSVRRLQALQAIGWPQGEIASRLGWGQARVYEIMHARQAVHVRTAAAVARLYDDLWDQPGPSVITAKRAAAKGWPPPLFWLDDEIDNPTVVPDYQPYRPMRGDELAAEAIRLSARGLSAVEVAERLGVSDRTVVRARSRYGSQTTGLAVGEAAGSVDNRQDVAA